MAKKDFENEVDYPEIVERKFLETGWKFNTKKMDGRTIFSIPMSAKNCPGLHIKLDVADDGDAKIRCYLAENTPESAHEELLEVLNSLNSRYRYITFSLDSDNDILAAYDFTIFGDDEDMIERHAGTMVMLTSDIMDKCLPKIMKVIWSAADDDDDEE